MFNYSEMDCEFCGYTGLLSDGDFDVECPSCGAEYSLVDDEEEIYDALEDED